MDKFTHTSIIRRKRRGIKPEGIKSSVINSDRLKRLGWKSKWDLKSGLSDCLKEFV